VLGWINVTFLFNLTASIMETVFYGNAKATNINNIYSVCFAYWKHRFLSEIQQNRYHYWGIAKADGVHVPLN
jgi:hypothetical protein